jgi:hypothetical protein
MVVFTQEDIECLFLISKRFDIFLECLGLDSEPDIVEQLMGDDFEITVERCDRDYILAWVVWKIEYSHETTAMWQSAKWAESDISGAIDKLVSRLSDKMVAARTSRTKHVMELENGSRLHTRPASINAARGMTINTLVIDGVEPKSKLYSELRMSGITRMKFGRGRAITILP